MKKTLLRILDCIFIVSATSFILSSAYGFILINGAAESFSLPVLSWSGLWWDISLVTTFALFLVMPMLRGN